MEEEIHYSSVVFKDGAPALRVNKEELSVYSSIKIKKPTTAATANQNEAMYSDIKKGKKKIKKENAPENQNEPIYSDIKEGKKKIKKENKPPKKNPETVFDSKNEEPTQTAVVKVQVSGSRSRLLLVGLGIICFLLCAIIIICISYFAMETKKLKQNLSDLKAKTEQLTLEKRDLQNQTEDLRMNMTKLENQNQGLIFDKKNLENQTEDLRMNMTKLDNQNQNLIFDKKKLENQTEDLRMNMTKLENQTQQLTAEKMFLKNQTMEMTVNMTILQNQNEQLRNNSDKLNKILAAIISYPNFPADLFCPDGVCQTCPKDWIKSEKSCYFFNHFITPLKPWDQSRQLCQSNKSDLVVISSHEEQSFIKNTIKSYYDFWHGYWIGLRKVNNIWIWVDGSPDTLGYWYDPEVQENFAIIAKDAPLNQSWIKNRIGFESKYICEIKALIF